jgi:hypothetical protein
MSKRNILVVCSNLEDLTKIEAMNISCNQGIIIITDNILVYGAAKSDSKVYRVFFFQEPIPYTQVVPAVIGIIREINKYFISVSKLTKIDASLMALTYAVEGGETQIIQDILLYVRSSKMLLKKYNISNVYFLKAPVLTSENVLHEVALQNKIKTTVAYGALFSLEPLALSNKIKNILKFFYFPLKTIVIKTKTQKWNVKLKGIKNIILFQLCNKHQKHINNLTFVFDDFLSNKCNPVVISWGCYKSAKYIKDKEYISVPLESLLSWSDFFLSIRKTINIIKNKRNLSKKFNQRNLFLYESVDLSRLIFPYIFEYLSINVPDNYRMQKSLKNIDFKANVVATNYCRAYYMKQGEIIASALDLKCISFDNNVGMVGRLPYTRFSYEEFKFFFDRGFITFVVNKTEKMNLLADTGYRKESIVIMGDKTNFGYEHSSKIESFRVLSIKNSYDYYILIDYSPQLFGFLSTKEVFSTFKSVFEFCSKNKKIGLIIKPHPSSKMDILNKMLDMYNASNIMLMKKNSSIMHLLNISDVFITKFSTVGRDAILHNVQVISLQFDNELMFENYKDAATYIYSTSQLIKFLESVFSSKKMFLQWTEEFKGRRLLYIKESCPELEMAPSKILVNTILGEINL